MRFAGTISYSKNKTVILAVFIFLLSFRYNKKSGAVFSHGTAVFYAAKSLSRSASGGANTDLLSLSSLFVSISPKPFSVISIIL